MLQKVCKIYILFHYTYKFDTIKKNSQHYTDEHFNFIRPIQSFNVNVMKACVLGTI